MDETTPIRSHHTIQFGGLLDAYSRGTALQYGQGRDQYDGPNTGEEVAKYNIRVNMIAPGYVNTPMLDGLPDGFSDYIIKKTPLKRFGEVEEIAGLVSFLASPAADFFTGQIFSPNGGLVI